MVKYIHTHAHSTLHIYSWLPAYSCLYIWNHPLRPGFGRLRDVLRLWRTGATVPWLALKLVRIIMCGNHYLWALESFWKPNIYIYIIERDPQGNHRVSKGESLRWSHLSSGKKPLPHLPGSAGFEVRQSDIQKGPLHDLCSNEGFLLALKGVMRVKENGLLWLGVPCNSILSSSKSISKHVLHPFVEMGTWPIYKQYIYCIDVISWVINDICICK